MQILPFEIEQAVLWSIKATKYYLLSYKLATIVYACICAYALWLRLMLSSTFIYDERYIWKSVEKHLCP
jgi:hypothetical protein